MVITEESKYWGMVNWTCPNYGAKIGILKVSDHVRWSDC